MLLIAFHTEYCKGHFFAHSLIFLHIGEANRSYLLRLLKQGMQRLCAALCPRILIPAQHSACSYEVIV
jgi:hypothetical protein